MINNNDNETITEEDEDDYDDESFEDSNLINMSNED